MSEICFFPADGADWYVTEFGYTAPTTPRTVGPWVRSTYILHYIIEGVCHCDDFDVGAGEAFLISKENLHRFRLTPPYRHYWIAFDGDHIAPFLSQWNIPLTRHTRFTVQCPLLAAAILEQGFKICKADTGSDAPAKSVLCALLPMLGVTEGESLYNAAKTAALFIERHYAHDITMTQVADSVHLSEKYLCKQFKKHIGVSPQQYLIMTRMRRAKSLLGQSELQVKEVALSVGYQNPLAFSAAFKAYTGQSPTEYREALLTEKLNRQV